MESHEAEASDPKPGEASQYKGHITEFEERLKAYKARLQEEPVREPTPSAARITSGLPQKSTIRLGDILVEQGVVARQMVEDTAELQKFRKNSRLGALLLKRKAITETHLARALAFQHGVPFARLGKLLNASDAFTSSLLPVEYISRFRSIPVEKESGRLLVVLEDPTNPDCLKELETAAGCPVDTVVSTPTEVLYIEKNFAAKEARLAAERAVVKEGVIAVIAAVDNAALELRREAQKEVEEARLAVQRADHDERQAAHKVVAERVEEEKKVLEACFVQETAALEGRYAAEQKALEERFAQAVKGLERKLELQKGELARRVEEENEAAERFISDQVNAERFALEARFTVQLNAAVEKLRIEQWTFEEQLAAQRALTAKAQSEKAALDRELAQALDTIKTTREAELAVKPAPPKRGAELWLPRVAAAAAVAAFAVSGWFNVPRGSMHHEAASPPPASVAMVPKKVSPPENAPKPLPPVEPQKENEAEKVKSKAVKPVAKADRARPAAKQEATQKRARPTARPEINVAQAAPVMAVNVNKDIAAPASEPEAALDRARPVETSSGVKRQEVETGRFVSAEDRRAAIKSLESRMHTGKIVLARLEEKLDLLVKELEKREKELVGDKAAGEGRQDVANDAQDRSAIEKYNARVSRYNKLLSDTRQVAAECDNVRQQNHQLSLQYRHLAAR